jgi:putative membrane protein
VQLLDEPARKRIEAAVASVEQRTAAEIAVVSVERSDGYHDLRALYAGACALAAAAGVHWAWQALGVTFILWIELGVAVLVWFLLSGGALLRLLLPAARTHGSARRRAHEAFLRHEVFATRARTGVLIFISELERCVVILGDSGIHAHVQDRGWQRHVDHLVSAIRAGRAADGACEVIEALGSVLAEHLPVQADDANELSNVVHTERS